MDRQQILEKVKKLLALAERGGTPEEAANAAAKAQAILERYHLDCAALDTEPEREAIGWGEPLESWGRKVTWRWELANAAADANDCVVLLSREYRTATTYVRIAGEPSDVAATRFFYAYLTAEIDRLLRLAPRPAWDPWLNGGWANSFRRGAVATIEQRLKAMRAQEAQAARARHGQDRAALVRLDDYARKGERVDAWVRTHVRVGTETSAPVGCYDGYSAGRAAGQSVDLGARARGRAGGLLTGS